MWPRRRPRRRPRLHAVRSKMRRRAAARGAPVSTASRRGGTRTASSATRASTTTCSPCPSAALAGGATGDACSRLAAAGSCRGRCTWGSSASSPRTVASFTLRRQTRLPAKSSCSRGRGPSCSVSSSTSPPSSYLARASPCSSPRRPAPTCAARRWRMRWPSCSKSFSRLARSCHVDVVHDRTPRAYSSRSRAEHTQYGYAPRSPVCRQRRGRFIAS
mmetsp:Transcript_46250/g.121292  ORF Transcript_46250/g.121292 Transcript_46250/m.121292 type:complete len:217 (-) Transcript_46250:154-804(-)